MNRILVNVVWFSSSRVSIVRNHDFFMRKTIENINLRILLHIVQKVESALSFPIVIFQGGDKDEARCKWYSWSANAFPLFVLFDTKMANMRMGHISNTPSDNCDIHVRCSWGNWRGQCWSVSLQRCSRTRTLRGGFSGFRKNFQSSN